MKQVTIENRNKFLSELRSGNYKKGTIKSNEKGFPVFENDSDKDGHCCCGIMAEMFGQTNTNKLSLSKATKALGITNKDCKYIQTKINDNDSTLKQNADRIELEIFNKIL